MRGGNWNPRPQHLVNLFMKIKRKPSYAEVYFKKGILKYLRDKRFRTEHPIDIFFADFAWVHKQKVIEIDGKMHLELEYSERDKYKDKILKTRGWQVMRIKFVNLLKNPKYWYKRADLFIGP